MEFGAPFIRAPTQQELKIAERVSACNAGDMDKDARFDKREKYSRKWKMYHRNLGKYRAGISKASFSRGDNSS